MSENDVEARARNSWLGTILAAAAPSVVGLVAAGQMINEIHQLSEYVTRLQEERVRLDARSAETENALARADTKIDRIQAEVDRRASRIEKLEQQAARAEEQLEECTGRSDQNSPIDRPPRTGK